MSKPKRNTDLKRAVEKAAQEGVQQALEQAAASKTQSAPHRPGDSAITKRQGAPAWSGIQGLLKRHKPHHNADATAPVAKAADGSAEPFWKSIGAVAPTPSESRAGGRRFFGFVLKRHN